MGVIYTLKNYRNHWSQVQKNIINTFYTSKTRPGIAAYSKFYSSTKVKENYVLYESFFGRGMTDNPYALFLELLDQDEFKDFEHFWVIDDLQDNAKMIARYQSNDHVHFIQYDSDAYKKALSECKYLINNSTFPPYFVKKKEQIYVNTWHGTPLKKMGYELPDGREGSANTVRNFLAADYLLSANEMLTNMYLDAYKMKEILPGKILEEGYPRNDRLVRTKREEIIRTLKDAGVRIEEGKKIILYAPTWRAGEDGKERVNPDELLEVKRVLEDNIDTDEYQILIKPHYFVYQYLQGMEEYQGLLIPSTIDTNEILSVVDVLISDYSSIFLDFLILRRPVLFYVPDLQEYLDFRGLSVSPDELPGPVSTDLQGLAENICHLEGVCRDYKDVYENMRNAVCRYDDGHVSARIIDIVFRDHQEGYREISVTPKKKKLLISPSELSDNGITQSFFSLLEQIDYDEWDVTAFVAQNAPGSKTPEKVDEINPHVRVLIMCGRQTATLQEDIRREFATLEGLYHSFWNRVYPWNAMKREFRRDFGDASFDYIVDFTGYSSVMAAILSCGQAKKKSIWLHSDIKEDMNRVVNGEKTMWRGLYFNVSIYPRFDHLVSCSQSVMEVNREKLGTPKTYDKFTYASNTVNARRIRKCLEEEETLTMAGQAYLVKNIADDGLASKELEIVKLPAEDDLNFVTMGRLSTEKNQIALVRAFARFQQEHPSSHLFIIGEGPLREDLEEAVTKLQLKDHVTLTGNIENPFAVMKRCDCFVLPSFYEGQPMVLMEARACGLAIIVSDFATVKDCLIPDGQLLIHTSEDSIYEGLCAYAQGKVPVADFSLDQYNQHAYEEFEQAIM